MNAREIAEFLAERFKPNHVNMADPYSYRQVGAGLYTIEKSWREHLIEQYMEDAQAFLLLMESRRLEFKEKPLV